MHKQPESQDEVGVWISKLSDQQLVREYLKRKVELVNAALVKSDKIRSYHGRELTRQEDFGVTQEYVNLRDEAVKEPVCSTLHKAIRDRELAQLLISDGPIQVIKEHNLTRDDLAFHIVAGSTPPSELIVAASMGSQEDLSSFTDEQLMRRYLMLKTELVGNALTGSEILRSFKGKVLTEEDDKIILDEYGRIRDETLQQNPLAEIYKSLKGRKALGLLNSVSIKMVNELSLKDDDISFYTTVGGTPLADIIVASSLKPKPEPMEFKR
ncbi:MAG: hypothetical protein V1744_07515 [Candidatus Altiarchaeota archaeon]